MKKIAILASAAVMMFNTAKAQYTLDKAHSSVGFTITHLSVSDIDGAFKTFDATLTSTKDDLSDMAFTFTAAVSSVNTESAQRDGHLQSPDFFDAAKNPNITFVSKSVKKDLVDGKYTIIGELTMHGVTKLVDLKATIKKATNPMTKKDIVGVKVTGTVDRTQFNIGSSMPDAALSNKVEIRVSGEFSK